MIKEISVDVDFNGMIIFDYPGILNAFNGNINDEQNILEEFTTTDKGDFVLDEGIALPIMGIDDGTYLVRFFADETPSDKNRKVIFSDKPFYLKVTGELYVADMAVFWEWEDYTGWKKTNIPKGIYEVCLEGVQLVNEENEITYGYDVIMNSISELKVRTIEPRSDSRVY
ncbi:MULTISPECIES: hypothetical protein [Yersinia pseudotuberculosis complex]|uniref:Uncharacterized protein n=1 Tax=Yersinia pseudotuberculosis serotype O:1b (strain IP 31758) TaxID=349747 RepID=A0A0U1QVR7_YERP3|nr:MULTISPECIES: hypothetical protein [Yersinia pseudotuberculosis complex]ABS46611.1 hypothetical protein YpsIP31758_0334 [Yersinia pseudotuberculosis IP 31758]AJK15087.1 hypothetical protein BZ19_3086 [Yersinia pseudotuberculosis str. PA3606]MCE4114846.1 hypothetical protein [Yersinia pseudotuberculosis]MCF1165462.1 hypothetical protein [Yersinia pseudotuberculosis]RYC16939.1 hypothetical protein EU971_22415 [Yersinia pseudotuberculosis]